MIIDKFIKITISKNFLKIFPNNKIGDVVDLPVDRLSKCSHIKVNVKCDICGKEKILTYQKYNKNISKHNIYTCSNTCAQIKNKKTSIDKFGKDHYSKTIEFKEKMDFYNLVIMHREKKDKNIKKSKSDNNRTKAKKTMIEKYGVDNSMLSEIFKNKLKNTVLSIYGVYNVFQNEDIKEKIKKTNIEKYGVEYPSQSAKIRDKITETLFTNYGVNCPLQSKEIREKSVLTCLKNWKVENPAQSEEIMNKIIKNRKQNRNYNLSEYQKYRIVVDKLTKKNKKKLFEEWDGYDYYDKEFIQGNMKLNFNHMNYPSIDHKTSVFYSFLNNIEIEKVSSLENLCITKRTNNSIKNRKNEDEFFKNFL